MLILQRGGLGRHGCVFARARLCSLQQVSDTRTAHAQHETAGPGPADGSASGFGNNIPRSSESGLLLSSSFSALDEAALGDAASAALSAEQDGTQDVGPSEGSVASVGDIAPSFTGADEPESDSGEAPAISESGSTNDTDGGAASAFAAGSAGPASSSVSAYRWGDDEPNSGESSVADGDGSEVGDNDAGSASTYGWGDDDSESSVADGDGGVSPDAGSASSAGAPKSLDVGGDEPRSEVGDNDAGSASTYGWGDDDSESSVADGDGGVSPDAGSSSAVAPKSLDVGGDEPRSDTGAGSASMYGWGADESNSSESAVANDADGGSPGTGPASAADALKSLDVGGDEPSSKVGDTDAGSASTYDWGDVSQSSSVADGNDGGSPDAGSASAVDGDEEVHTSDSTVDDGSPDAASVFAADASASSSLDDGASGAEADDSASALDGDHGVASPSSGGDIDDTASSVSEASASRQGKPGTTYSNPGEDGSPDSTDASPEVSSLSSYAWGDEPESSDAGATESTPLEGPSDSSPGGEGDEDSGLSPGLGSASNYAWGDESSPEENASSPAEGSESALTGAPAQVEDDDSETGPGHGTQRNPFDPGNNDPGAPDDGAPGGWDAGDGDGTDPFGTDPTGNGGDSQAPRSPDGGNPFADGSSLDPGRLWGNNGEAGGASTPNGQNVWDETPSTPTAGDPTTPLPLQPSAPQEPDTAFLSPGATMVVVLGVAVTAYVVTKRVREAGGFSRFMADMQRSGATPTARGVHRTSREAASRVERDSLISPVGTPAQPRPANPLGARPVPTQAATASSAADDDWASWEDDNWGESGFESV